MTVESTKPNVDNVHPNIYVDLRNAGSPEYQYVAWLDVMGTSNSLRVSPATAANAVMRLHVAALETLDSGNGVDLYPMIDGLYACSPSQPSILSFVARVMQRLTNQFMATTDYNFRFMVRCGLAYGAVWSGAQFAKCSKELGRQPDYCSRIVLGMPLTQAHDAQQKAAPFGVYIDESARAFSPSSSEPITFAHWQWWRGASGPRLAVGFAAKIEEYFDWCERFSLKTGYPPDKIREHHHLCSLYFGDSGFRQESPAKRRSSKLPPKRPAPRS